MAQILTVVSVLARVKLLGRSSADRVARWWNRAGSSERLQATTDVDDLERPVYRASAHEFLHGAADLTFGIVILGLAFFMLMWVIANG